jgi:hypothetical protein
VPGLFEQIKAADVTGVNVLADPPNGRQWLCTLAEEEPLFVRECYAWFYEEAIRKMNAKPKCPGVIYTGNPGIGKSAWLNYALVRFLQDGYAVVLERAQEGDYFVFREKSCTRQKHQRPDLDELPEKAVYLFDPDERDSCPLESNVFTIVASSPLEKHYKALKKLGAGRYYFPCWKLAELKAARPQMDPARVEELFHKWGGIPRYIFTRDESDLEADLLKAITGLDLSLVFKYMKSPEISEDDQKVISHILVQYRIVDRDDVPPFKSVELDFASEWVGEQIVETEARRGYNRLIAHYREVRRTEWQGAYCGHLWEHLCHAIIPLGAKEGLRLEPLPKGKKQNRCIVKTAVTAEKGKLENMMAALEKGCYFQPSASNFPVIDALVMEGNDIFGFQMTVASSHPPKAYQTAKLLEIVPAGKKLHLVWVVDGEKENPIAKVQLFQQSKSPEKKVDASQMSKLQALPQWMLKLRFPKESPFANK